MLRHLPAPEVAVPVEIQRHAITAAFGKDLVRRISLGCQAPAAESPSQLEDGAAVDANRSDMGEV